MYRFVGGGLPPHIRTLAIDQFENDTPQPALSSNLQQKLQDQLARNLGVRITSSAVADAVVRGTIRGYEETAPGLRTGGNNGRFDVIERKVRITADVEIYDLREDRPLYKNSALAGEGTYQASEQPLTGQARALDQLVEKVVQGAQSQW